ncbi:YadA-like family protein [Haemophilus parainfluenzae]|uniref:YadA-like family protein n=1 Tax=Haemophilus parainfluenzae TaxID=729 RepID=UPI0018A33EE8|nr:YadA-like family protein [Haemophilus parainfluenzae]QOR11308.1 YadA-like family protein [Haemophilus parainfluenzae]
MKNFKFNAITALIIGVNVAVANAADGNILNITTQDAVNASKTIEATNVKGPGHTAIGQQNQIYSIPAAEAEESQGSSSAIGNQNVVKGEQANAIGDGNDAYGHFTQSVGDDNKVYADHSLGFGAHNKVGTQRAKGTPEKDVVVDKNTSKASVFGLNNEVVGKNIFVAGNDNKITDTSTTNATVIGFGATANSANATAIGTAASALANETIAIGQAAKASGQNSNAYGSQANASGTSSLAVGTGSVASGDSAVAIGNDSTVTGGSAVAIGASATSTGKWSTALGDSANAKGEKSVALSKDSYAKDDNSVALGSGTITRSATNVTTATVNGITYSGFAGNSNNIAVVSVGSDKTETYTPSDHSTPGRTVTITPHTRQIINVGAGEISSTSTDAINGSQLYMVADQVGKNKTRIDNIRVRTSDVKVKAGDNINVQEAYDDANQVKTYTVSTAKDIKADSYTVNNSSVQINQNGINAGNKNITNVADPKAPTDAANKRYVDNKVNKVDRKTRAGIAGVAAIASAPSARKDGKSMVSTGVAHHRGESAIAIKASRNSDNGHWSTNVNGAADTRGQFTVGAGVGYEW